MIADACLDAGRFRPPADDAVGVLLEEGIGCKLAGLAARGAEEIAVDVIGNAGRFDIVVQTLIETMMTGKVATSLPRRAGSLLYAKMRIDEFPRDQYHPIRTQN